MSSTVLELLKASVEGKGAEGRVFTWPNGKAVVDFRDRWTKACCAARLGNMHCSECDAIIVDRRCPQCKCFRRANERVYRGLIFHDLRRTAARNLRRAGLPESLIMQIGGWRTTNVFHRYAIVDRKDMAAAMRQYEEYQARLALASEVKTPESQFGHSLGTNDDFQVTDTPKKGIQ